MLADLTKPAIVYIATNKINGKQYVGVTTRGLHRRRMEHLASARAGRGNGAFYRAIRKYGAECFEFAVHLECRDTQVALLEEVRLIKTDRPAYNSTPGAEGFRGMSAEGRAKISAIHKGRQWGLGRRASLETKALHSQRALLRMVEFRSWSHLGPKTMARKVLCLNDRTQHESASAAARAYRLSRSSVTEVCNRIPRRASAGGMVFRYADDPAIDYADIDIARRRSRKEGQRKAVLCITDGRVFDSLAAAANFYEASAEGIGQVCRGLSKKVYGLQFEFVGGG